MVVKHEVLWKMPRLRNRLWVLSRKYVISDWIFHKNITLLIHKFMSEQQKSPFELTWGLSKGACRFRLVGSLDMFHFSPKIRVLNASLPMRTMFFALSWSVWKVSIKAGRRRLSERQILLWIGYSNFCNKLFYRTQKRWLFVVYHENRDAHFVTARRRMHLLVPVQLDLCRLRLAPKARRQGSEKRQWRMRCILTEFTVMRFHWNLYWI